MFWLLFKCRNLHRRYGGCARLFSWRRAFADSWVIVADESVPAIEVVVVAYVGAGLVGDFASGFQEKVRADAGSPVAVRSSLLGHASAFGVRLRSGRSGLRLPIRSTPSP